MALLLIFSLRHSSPLEYNVEEVYNGAIREEVSVTGKVKLTEGVNLSFRSTGNVAGIWAHTGEAVEEGQVIANLENDDLQAQLNQARANLEIEKAQLSELRRGARTENVSIKEKELEQAQKSLHNYYQDAQNVLSDACAKSEEALKIDIKDVFFGADAANCYVFSFDACTPNEVNSEAGYYRLLSERKLKEWKQSLSLLNENSSAEDWDTALRQGKEYLVFFNSFFDKLNNVLLADCSYSNANLDTYRANANHGRNLIITAESNMDDLRQSIDIQFLTRQKIEEEFNLLLAGATAEEMAIQEARVRYAEAEVANRSALLEKTLIRAPWDGFVSKQDIVIGEIVMANTPVVGVMAEKGLELEMYIPEVDISKVKIGDPTFITLDAFPQDEFNGEMISVEFAETIMDGVVYYKGHSNIDSADANIKSGMTGDVVIVTAAKDNVLSVPQRAILEKDGKKIVRIPQADGYREAVVTTGLRSPEGYVEILSGLHKGDMVITFMKNN